MAARAANAGLGDLRDRAARHPVPVEWPENLRQLVRLALAAR
jgi:hypothetical protein